MADKPNPFDVAALERALNDSATRVSTIWISFLLFGLYLVIAAGTVTHRQLLLQDPVKLPALNIDLPLVGFFFLAPMLFVVFHLYVLLQVLLLGRTAAAYNEALDRTVKPPLGNASMRQRLANTLFAQIFAGSPRERKGWLGVLLQMIAWLTLAIAPALVLLVIQFQFLPYHSSSVTWTHRILIALDLVAVLVLWPALRYPDRDVSWRTVLRRWFPLPFAIALVALTWIVLTFPGEPHAEWTRSPLNSAVEVECETVSPISAVFSHFDRLYLAHVDVVDHEKLKSIERNTTEAGELDFQGERTRILSERDLNCANFLFADLRRVDLTGTSLRGAFARAVRLQGASLDRAQLQGADFSGARLQGASLLRAKLQGANLAGARLQGAALDGAQLQGANLNAAVLQAAYLGGASLQGASLVGAQLQGAYLGGVPLQGAYLGGARLQGASLPGAELYGADLHEAKLEGADLRGAELQGADLHRAQLRVADLREAQLQGSDLEGGSLTYANLTDASVWRARNATCQGARVTIHKPTDIIKRWRGIVPAPEDEQATPEAVARLIDNSVKGISSASYKKFAIDHMRAGLIVDPAKDDTAAIEEVWRQCEKFSDQISQDDFARQHAAFLRDLACGATFVSNDIARLLLFRDDFATQLARALLGEDGKPCAATKDIDEETKKRLRAFVLASELASAARK